MEENSIYSSWQEGESREALGHLSTRPRTRTFGGLTRAPLAACQQ